MGGGCCSPRDQTRHETLCPGIARHCPELGDPHPGEKATPLTPQMLSRPAWVTCPWAQWSQDVLGPRSGLRSEKKKKINFYIEENDSVSDVTENPFVFIPMRWLPVSSEPPQRPVPHSAGASRLGGTGRQTGSLPPQRHGGSPGRRRLRGHLWVPGPGCRAPPGPYPGVRD